MPLYSTYYVTNSLDLQNLNWSYEVIFVDASNGNVDLIMPEIDGDGLGFQIKRLDESANSVYLHSRTPNATIAGLNVYEINVQPTASLISFQSKWHLL